MRGELMEGLNCNTKVELRGRWSEPSKMIAAHVQISLCSKDVRLFGLYRRYIFWATGA